MKTRVVVEACADSAVENKAVGKVVGNGVADTGNGAHHFPKGEPQSFFEL